MYVLDDGTQCSRSSFIRQEFNKNKSRRDIALELSISYNTVYNATANMTNKLSQTYVDLSKVQVARVNTNFEYIDANGNLCDENDVEYIPGTELINHLFGNGLSRSEIAEYFDVTYNSIYNITRNHSNAKKQNYKIMLTLSDGSEVFRVDYIRQLFKEGLTRKEIASHITFETGELVDYTTVWLATKELEDEL